MPIRIRTRTPEVSGAGGGGGTTADVYWTPHYAEDPLDAQASIALQSIGVNATLNAEAAFTLSQVAANFTGSPLVAQGTLTMPTVSLTMNALTANAKIASLTVDATIETSSKDGHYSNPPLCATDTGNGTSAVFTTTRLTEATRQDAVCAFDISGFKSNSWTACELADFSLVLSSNANAIAAEVNVGNATNATETWTEATIKCSTKPTAVSGGLGVLAVPAATTPGTRISVTGLTGDELTRMLTRINTESAGTFSFMLTSNLLGDAIAWVAREDTSPSLRPNLRIKLRKDY